MSTQEKIAKAQEAAEALADALMELNSAASHENTSAGCLLHMLVMPQIKAAADISSQLQQIQTGYNFKPE